MHTIVFVLSFLRLHLILSRIQKSKFNFSLAFSQSNTTVVPLLVSAILAPMKLYLVAPTAKLTNTKLMGRHHKPNFSISLLSHGYVQCFPIHSMPRKCNTAHNTNMILQRLQTFLMVLITAHCWRLLSLLVMKKFQCGSSQILGILHWVYQQMALVPSSSATRLLGPLSFSITIFLLKKGLRKKTLFPLGPYLDPRNLLTLIFFLWPLVQELLQLEIGVSAFDVIAQVSF